MNTIRIFFTGLFRSLSEGFKEGWNEESENKKVKRKSNAQ